MLYARKHTGALEAVPQRFPTLWQGPCLIHMRIAPLLFFPPAGPRLGALPKFFTRASCSKSYLPSESCVTLPVGHRREGRHLGTWHWWASGAPWGEYHRDATWRQSGATKDGATEAPCGGGATVAPRNVAPRWRHRAMWHHYGTTTAWRQHHMAPRGATSTWQHLAPAHHVAPCGTQPFP
jgi:hypothetical protein